MRISFKSFLEAVEKPAKVKKAKIVRMYNHFEAWVGKQKVGQLYFSNYGGHYLLDSVDVQPEFQRRGYALQMMRAFADYLKSAKALSLASSNEGSGTVQLLDKVFGRENVKHTHGGEEIDFDQAVHVMDVMYGRTGSKINLQPQSI